MTSLFDIRDNQGRKVFLIVKMADNVDHYESMITTVFDIGYSPFVRDLKHRVPLYDGETSEQYAMRVAVLTRIDPEVATLMKCIMVAGDEIIRYSIRAYRGCLVESDYGYFKRSGYRRLVSIFVLLFPYQVLLHVHDSGKPFPNTFRALFDVASDTALTTTAWYKIILPESMISMDHFPEATLRAIHDY